MKLHKIIAITFLVCSFWSCDDYLDVVPDNVATLDMVFNTRTTAERYLFTCYSYIPKYGDQTSHPGLAAGNETWFYTANDNSFSNQWTFFIAMGFQNTQSPVTNYWDGENVFNKSLFQAIRDCNIFLDYVSDRSRVNGLNDTDRRQWLAEIKILKAFYHYYLLQLYGPIPIVDDDLPINSLPEDVQVSRNKVDDVVDYIVKLIDEAWEDLPVSRPRPATEEGRLTQPAALAIKAKVLLLAASPIFNGNTKFANFKDRDGQPFINQIEDKGKWQKAAEAAKAAIDLIVEKSSSSSLDKLLYTCENDLPEIAGNGRDDQDKLRRDTMRYIMNVRCAVTQRFSKELVWSVGMQDSRNLQLLAMARLIPSMDKTPENNLHGNAKGIYAPTLATAERFYSSNGVPIEEDKNWRENGWYNDRYTLCQVSDANPMDTLRIKRGTKTARLNFNREARFYGSLGFDRSTWYGNGWMELDKSPNYIAAKRGEKAGIITTGIYSITGYFAKKLINVENEVGENVLIKEYPFPIIRLADLYLSCAEALNEATEGEEVDLDIYQYIDAVRARSGLKGVQESWRDHSIYPEKPNTKTGMREIIRRERLIEFALEGQHYFDIRRWMLADKEFVKPVQGWNVQGKEEADYYQIKTIYTPKIFLNKQYFWPIKDQDIVVNRNLIQSYGW